MPDEAKTDHLMDDVSRKATLFDYRTPDFWIFVGGFLTLITICTVFWVTFAYLETGAARMAIRNELDDRLDDRAFLLTRSFRIVEQELRVAAQTTDIKNYSTDRLAATSHLLVIARNTPTMTQARILDTGGLEVIRIDRTPNGYHDIEQQHLQDKSARYYFQSAIELAVGSIYVSPLDLNVEGDKIEIPWKPTVRFATPLIDDQGDKTGVLIFNIDMTSALEPFGVTDEQRVDTFLMNGNGYWLAGTPREKLWGFMTNENASMALEQPELWGLIGNIDTSGYFEHDGTVFAVRRISLTDLVVRDMTTPSWQTASQKLIVYGTKPLINRLARPRQSDFVLAVLVITGGLAISYVIARLYATRRITRQIRENIADQVSGIQRMASLGRIVAGVAHELRTPIGNARTAVSALSESVREFRDALEGDALRRSFLEAFLEDLETGTRIVERNIERSVALIGHFKQTAADQTNQKKRKFDAATVLRDLAETLKSQYQKRGITIIADLEPDLIMTSYPGAIDQVVLNLFQNAETHAFDTDHPGPKLFLKAYGKDNNHLCIEISDNGNGIDKDHIERIFEPFWTTKRIVGGTGLGLSIVANIVENLLGGEIHVSSVIGEGTIFVLNLPFDASEIASQKTEFEAGM